MESIKLSQEQKDKLLEMCKVLFQSTEAMCSGFDYFRIINNNIEGLSRDLLNFENKDLLDRDNNAKEVLPEEYENWEFSIHWFEFCMLHLVQAVQNSLPNNLIWREQPPYVGNIFGWKKGNKWTMYSEFFFNYPKQINQIHPIDYLYEEFLKLK